MRLSVMRPPGGVRVEKSTYSCSKASPLIRFRFVPKPGRTPDVCCKSWPPMSVMNRIRLYHASLAVLALLAYLTSESGRVHAWLGYSVAIIILLRLLWAIGGERQAGLMRFYPNFQGLKLNRAMAHPAISRTLMLAIGLCLITAAGTGVAMDRGRTLGLTRPGVERSDQDADIAERRIERSAYRHDEDDEEHGDEPDDDSVLSEVHELAGNLLLIFVGLHVTYLLVFKQPLARFMLFIPVQGRKPPVKVPPT